jgi:hypothetical protein
MTAAESKKADPAPSSRVSKAVRNAILSPGVLVFVAGVRLLIIANYDPTTASSIASSSGIVGTLLGTLIPVIPILLPLLGLTLFVFRKPLLLVFALLGTALVSPTYSSLKNATLKSVHQFWAFFHTFGVHNSRIKSYDLHMIWLADRSAIVFGAIATAFFTADRFRRILNGFKADSSDSEADAFGLGVVYLVFLLIGGLFLTMIFGTAYFFTTTIYHIPDNVATISSAASKPWLPSEVVTLKSGKTSVGYALASDDAWFVFLEEGDRTIDYFPAADVKSRVLCRLPGEQRPIRPPLFKLISAPAPMVARCPRESQ